MSQNADLGNVPDIMEFNKRPLCSWPFVNIFWNNTEANSHSIDPECHWSDSLQCDVLAWRASLANPEKEQKTESWSLNDDASQIHRDPT